VSVQGDDQNDCSNASPCRTIQHAADVVDQPGSVILVDDGDYVGFHSVHDAITFRANGQNVVISSGEGGAQDNINIEGNNDVRVEGFVVRDATRTGIRVVTGSSVTVKGNRIGPNGRWGILTGFAVGVRILNNETFDSAVEHGIYVGNSDSPDDNPWICGNDSHGNQGNGIQINGDCYAGGDGMVDGALLENNHVHDNHLKGLSMISAPTIRILNNVIHDNGIDAGAGGIHLVTEPGCGDDHATSYGIVAHNTVVEPHIAAIRMNDGATGNVIFNNILISSNPAADEVGGNFISMDNLTQGDTTGLLFDTMFKPAAGSIAIDKGVASYQGENAPAVDIVGVMRPLGAGFDMGAYEVQ
jgi:hypothetical protein